MTSQNQTTKPKSSPPLVWAFLPLCILIVPLVAMRFTDAVEWGVGDFSIAALLLMAVGLGGILIARERSKFSAAMLLGGLIVLVALFTWIELAVGIL